MTQRNAPAPATTPTCPKCQSREFRLFAVRHVRAYVTFTPDGEHDVEDVKHDEIEWDDTTLTECVNCRFTAALGEMRGGAERTAPTPLVWEASATWEGQESDLGLHAAGDGALLACLAHARQVSDGEPPEHTGTLRWRLEGPLRFPVLIGTWEDVHLRVRARAVLE